jgi:hypothetical protein
MMHEILKPLLENDVLTDEVKDSIEIALTEAIRAREDAVRTEVETLAKKNFEAAKNKFEETFNTLQQTYKVKLDEAKVEIEKLESKVEDLETKPFVNVTESDLEAAENKLVEELEEKFSFKEEKYNEVFELIQEENSHMLTEMTEVISEYEDIIEGLNEEISDLKSELHNTVKKVTGIDIKISEAVAATEVKMRAETDQRIETLKENLVTSTEIFLEQELSEVKADKEEMMKETQGRELLESIKGLVKQYWDIDSEVAAELLEMKKSSEAKVEQYKDMLKKEHLRLEESQQTVEKLKKRVIVESKGSVLTGDKKNALEKLAENIESDKLEDHIDSLMESVINTFNDGFTKEEVVSKVKSKSLTESATPSKKTTISSGDTYKKDVVSDELAELLSFAGVTR